MASGGFFLLDSRRLSFSSLPSCSCSPAGGGTYRRTGSIRPRQARGSLIFAKASSYPFSTERIEREEVMRMYEASQRESERHQLEKKKKVAKTYWGWLGLQGLWWWSVLKSAKISTNGRPPFSPRKASKPLRVLPSSPLCPSSSLLEPPTCRPSAFYVNRAFKSRRLVIQDTRDGGEDSGGRPEFLPKEWGFWNLAGEEGEAEKEESK